MRAAPPSDVDGGGGTSPALFGKEICAVRAVLMDLGSWTVLGALVSLDFLLVLGALGGPTTGFALCALARGRGRRTGGTTGAAGEEAGLWEADAGGAGDGAGGC